MGKHEFDDKEKHFRNQVGISATVERGQMGAEKASIPNRMLCDLGLKLQETDDYLKHFRYMGSAAVHIFMNETLEQITFVSQTQPLHLYRCPELLASKAFDDLLQELKASYGHKRSLLRSGF